MGTNVCDTREMDDDWLVGGSKLLHWVQGWIYLLAARIHRLLLLDSEHREEWKLVGSS